MQDLGWRRRWGSCPAARTGARQRAGLTPASASNTLSCLLEMLHSKQLRSIKMLVDSNHGIYRVQPFCCDCSRPLLAVRPEGANHQWRKIPPGELSIDPVADERLGWVTGRAGAS